MTREQEFKNKKMLGIDLEAEEKEALKDIALRETGGNISKMGRKAIQEYIKAHASGNTSYTLDDFGKHKDMIAIPALMANRDSLSEYVKEEYDRQELEKVLKQCEFLQSIIRSKLLTQKNDPDFKSQQRRSSRSRLTNDIRFKDPANLSVTERTSWRQIRSQYTDEEWELLQNRLKKEWDGLHTDQK